MKTPLDLHIGTKLRKIRIAAKFSRNALSELIGITIQQISKYENGINRIPASRLYEIAQIFGEPISCFFEGYVDDNYYNFRFKDEGKPIELHNTKNKELANLIKSFNKIENYEVRRNIIELVNSIGRS